MTEVKNINNASISNVLLLDDLFSKLLLRIQYMSRGDLRFYTSCKYQYIYKRYLSTKQYIILVEIANKPNIKKRSIYKQKYYKGKDI